MTVEQSFEALLEPCLGELERHCLRVTGSPWDAEDLKQETLLKLYAALRKEPSRALSKAFVKRVASNAWMDARRKKRVETEAFEEDRHSEADPAFDVREAFEVLADRLTVQQMVLVLLVDIFRFTAREAAELIASTEGAVKEGVKRARKRLKDLAAGPMTPVKRVAAVEQDKPLIEVFLQAFRDRNPRGIYDAYNELRGRGITVARVQKSAGMERLFFYFRDPDGHLIGISA